MTTISDDNHKGGVDVVKALKILALPRLAGSLLHAPQSWHSGGFDDKKCINATRDCQLKVHKSFSHHYQGRIDFTTVNLFQSAGITNFVAPATLP